MDWSTLIWAIIITVAVVWIIVAHVKNKEISKANHELENQKVKYAELIEQTQTERKTYINSVVTDIQKIVEQKCEYYPQLAAIMADLETMYIERSADYLCNKRYPAYDEAKRIREVREDCKIEIEKRKNAEYRLSYITKIYPQLQFITDPNFNKSNPPELITSVDQNTIDRKNQQLQLLHDEMKQLRVEYQKIIDQLHRNYNDEIQQLRLEYQKEIEQIYCNYESLQQVIETLDLYDVFNDYPEWMIPKPLAENYRKSLTSNRLIKSQQTPFEFKSPIEISCKTISQTDGQIYYTSLSNCSCPDFKANQSPCKHMLSLAIRLNAFIFHSDTVNDALNDLVIKAQLLDEQEQRVKKEKVKIENAKKIVSEKQQTYPFLATLMAEYKQSMLDIAIREHVTKRDMIAKLKQAEKEKAMLHNQIAVYEYMFPILNEFKDVPPLQLSQTIENSKTTGFQYQWLTEEEYVALTSEEKQQRWIDRYLGGNSRSNWEAGIKYERYIGYLCEKEGCNVKYTGATLKLNDMGRDLIAFKEKTIYIIQCKRYAQGKEVHENHLFQLFGSVAHYKKEHPNHKVIGVFVTSSQLSDVAKQCAESLSVLLYENIPFKSYPTIKCNIGKNGEKIYHLPFDQQYDNITIQFSKGEFYADTIVEAKAKDFRHAMKHLFSN